MVTIRNSEVCVTVAELGAEIQSIVRDGVEYMWSRNPEFWKSCAPIMFPICGGLRNGKYELDGVSYEMPKHGFARFMEYEVESKTETSVTFVLRDNEESRKSYPYAFLFRVIYELDGASLKVTYDAENLDDKIMYCTFGGHEAYACPEGIEAYEIEFPEKETLYAYALNGDLLTDYTKLMVNNSNILPLDDRHFVLDALVFRDVKSNSVTLKSKVSSRRVRVDFDGFDYLVLWHKHTAPYLCIEPWCGVQDVAGSSPCLAEKEGIHAVAVGGHFARTHVITVG
jgi:galactose mutarotase-like enzyme